MRLDSDSALAALRHNVLIPALALAYGLGVLACAWVGAQRLAGTPATGLFGGLSIALASHCVAVTLIVMQGLLGRWLLGLMGLDRLLDRPLERALFGFVLGFVASETLLLALAALGLLGAASVLATAGAIGVSAAVQLRRIAPRWLRIQREMWRRPDRNAMVAIALGAVLLALACIWLAPLLVQTALPNSDWDSALYHLPLASRYIAGQLFNGDPLLPSGLAFPGAVNLFYAALVAIGYESAIIPLNFWLTLLCAAAVFSFASRLAGRRAGVFALLAFASTHIGWQLSVDPRVDGFLAFFVLMALYALALWTASPDRPRLLLLVAVALGAAMGTKYTGLLFAGGIGAWALATLVAQRRRLGLGLVGACALLLMLPNVVWYAGNVALHGDPLFPMLRGDYFFTPEGDRQYVSAELELPGMANDAEIQSARDRFDSLDRSPVPRSLFDLWDLFARPDAYATRPNHFASPLLLLFLALPLCLPRAPGERRAAFSLWGLGLLLFGLLGSQTNLLRYAMPLLALFAVGAGLVMGRFASPLWQGFWIVAAVALLLVNFEAERQKLALLDAGAYLSGEKNRLQWLRGVGYNFQPAMPAAIAHINRRIASGAMREGDTILMLGEGKGHLLECGYVADASWYLEPWLAEVVNARLDLDRVRESLAERGIDYILYNRDYFSWVLKHTETNRDQIAFAMVHLGRFLQKHGRIVYDRDGILLVELPTGP